MMFTLETIPTLRTVSLKAAIQSGPTPIMQVLTALRLYWREMTDT